MEGVTVLVGRALHPGHVGLRTDTLYWSLNAIMGLACGFRRSASSSTDHCGDSRGGGRRRNLLRGLRGGPTAWLAAGGPLPRSAAPAPLGGAPLGGPLGGSAALSSAVTVARSANS